MQPHPTNPHMYVGPTPPTQKRKWPWIIGGIVGAVVLLCCGFGVLSTMAKDPAQRTLGVVDTAAPTTGDSTPLQPVTIEGNGPTVVPINLPDGNYVLDYRAQAFCLMVWTLDAGGNQQNLAVGACNDQLGENSLSGTTIVRLDHTALLQIENLDSGEAWSLTFKA